MRAPLTEYVKAHGLVSAERKGAVLLDGLLAGVVGKRAQVRCWKKLRVRDVSFIKSARWPETLAGHRSTDWGLTIIRVLT